MAVCGCFCVKNGPKKNRNVSKDCTMAEGEFEVNKIMVLMVSVTEEPSVDEDESAMVT